MTQMQQTYLTFHGIRLIIEATIFVIIFSHVWTRKGYEGADGILDLKEVDKFVAHIVAVASLITLDTFFIWEPLMSYQTSWEWKLLFGSGFLGSGFYMIFGNTVKNKLLGEKKTDTPNDKT